MRSAIIRALFLAMLVPFSALTQEAESATEPVQEQESAQVQEEEQEAGQYERKSISYVGPEKRVIIGLGNPGFWYRNTRHNIGFRVCRQYAAAQGWKIKQRAYGSRYCSHQGIVVALPQLYMNRSGQAVSAVLKAFEAKPGQCLVVVDDFQLPLGSLRIRAQGSSGGHKGLESIGENIGNDYCRMRLGIGPKPEGKNVTKFVLGRWSRSEKPQVRRMIDQAIEAITTFAEAGIELAASRHSRRPQKGESSVE